MTLDSAAHKANWFSRLAHPGNFMAWSRYALWPLGLASAVAFAFGIYAAFFVSPLASENVGETLRIMYVHVPTAWLSQFVYGVMAVAALGTLVWRHPLADVAGKAAAPLGAAFTALALFTGALWGRPAWGTFWEWDGRMTSTLLLLLIYLGIIALWRVFDDKLRAGRLVAIVTLVGALNIPVIKFSVDWWHTLHQPASVFVTGGPKMPGNILTPFLTMLVAFTLLFLLLHFVAMRTEILNRRADSLSRQAAMRGHMIELGKHADYVVFAWVGVALVTLLVIGWVWLQSRRAKARIAALESQGIRRRSEGPAA